MAYEWMGRYRRLVSAIVVQGNEYSKQQNIKHEISDGLFLSSQEWQILEYIVEHADECNNMIYIADSLGIPQSTFSKTVKLLCELDLTEKFQSTTNKKNIILRPTEYAQRVYEENSKKLGDSMFNSFFEIMKDVDDKDIEKFTLAMEALCAALIEDGKAAPAEPVLIRVKK